ncbi:MAG: copper amine oxidase N-terminal domain-containing protein [Oscillospiraceae bacterium]|nr:copper amine oxidase N-terminal domain-containing protein [Oscillospiraceae bacterium]
MKKFKKALPFALVGVMLLLSACRTTNDYPPVEEDYPNYEQPATLPEDIEADEVTEPEDVDADYETDIDLDYVWPTIFVNGEGIPDVDHMIVGDDIFPTHVPLIPVANALGVAVEIGETDPMIVTLEGLNGDISFTLGSEDFTVNGEVITLNQPSVEIDGAVYVPVTFFRDVFGGSAFSSGGEVHISTDAEDMM